MSIPREIPDDTFFKDLCLVNQYSWCESICGFSEVAYVAALLTESFGESASEPEGDNHVRDGVE
jgi:hypothetical protein